MTPDRVLDTLTHIETPENIRLAFRLAGAGSRLGAYILDFLIRGVLLTMLSIVMGLLGPLMGFSGLPAGVWLVGAFLLEWGYGCVLEGLWNGQTVGKRALGLRVITAEGYTIGFYQAILRNLLRVADALPVLYGVGLITILSTRRMQRIGDLVAGTIVVREIRQRWRGNPADLKTIEPIPRSSFRNAYSPAERTLGLLEELFQRQSHLGSERLDEIAAILAYPLAQRLVDAQERTEARREPARFLLRVLRTFRLPGEHLPSRTMRSYRAVS